MSQTCTQTDLLNIAKGACFLASGGGGSYESGEQLANRLVKSDYYPAPTFDIISLDQIDADGYGVVVAYMGAPEAIKSAFYPVGAVRAAEQVAAMLETQGKKLKYVVPVEVGALSSVVPCLVASKLGLQVIDGDGAGRAVPELTMLSFPARGIPGDPTVLANGAQFSMIIHADGDSGLGEAATIEQSVRPILALPQFNEIAGLAIWVMSAEQMRHAVQSTGTLHLARKTGEKIAAHGLPKVLEYLGDHGKSVFQLFEGSFDPTGCSSQTGGGFDHGTITLSNGTDRFSILYQNEALLGWNSRSPQPAALAPDSIALFVEDEQKAYSIADVTTEDGGLDQRMLGKRVSVIGIAADPFLRQGGKDGLLPEFTAALEKLGYYGEYKTIEQLNGR